MDKIKSIKSIKKAIIYSCINNKPSLFIPYLMSTNVVTDMPNKLRFYRFFKNMCSNAQTIAEGELFLKIEASDWLNDSQMYCYSFYDKVHLHQKLTVEIKETKGSIFFSIPPF
jgi:hypothetical protein